MLRQSSEDPFHFSMIVLVLLLSFFSCRRGSEYEQLVERELNKGVRHDSLFLGYRLGMEKKEFLDHSWQLNQQGVVTGGAYVKYKLNDLSHEAQMVFYPDFYNDRIYRMPVEVSYSAWAPWNKNLFSDSLITDLVARYKEIYGPGFIHTVLPDLGKEAWIKVDGNRRIAIYREDDMRVRVVFMDLLVQQKLNE